MAFALAPFALLTVVGCENSPDPLTPSEPQALVIDFVGPDTAIGVAGAELAEPIIVSVRRISDGRAAKGVRLSLSANGGTVTPSQPVTDREGIAKVRWILPTAADQEAVLKVNFADSSVVTVVPPDRTFRVRVLPDVPASLEKTAGDGQLGPPGATLLPLEVQVKDQYGNPVPDVEVEWESDENSVVTIVKSRSDEEGRSRTEVVLGERLGTSTVTARAGKTSGMAVFAFDIVPASSLVPSAIEVFAGADQHATVNTTVEPIAVRVLDEHGRPVPSVRVEWSVVAGEGLLRDPWNYTDRDGVATNIWRYGKKSGVQRVVARISEHTATTEVVGVAKADVPAVLSAVSGSQQEDTVTKALPKPYVVRVSDQYGNPVPEAEVRWDVLPGGGEVSAAFTLTDDGGTASVTHTLGRTAGLQAVRAMVEGLTASALFTSRALPGPAVGVIVHAGGGQVGAPGTLLADSLVAKVVDEWENGVGGAELTWTVSSGGGTLSASTTTTDSTGLAAVSYQLGNTLGPQTIRARLSDNAETQFTVRAADLVLMIERGADQSGVIKTNLPQDLVVLAIDAKTNAPVPDATVNWKVLLGDGEISAASTRTDADGFASVTWRLGPKAGRHEVEARIGNRSVVFSAFATGPLGEARIELVSGNGQTSQPGSTLQPFVVRVTTPTGAPVEGVTVDWSLQSSAGVIHPATSNTDTLGRAATVATLPSYAPATITVVARVATLADTIVFTAHALYDTPLLSLQMVSGNTQVGDAMRVFALPLVVAVRDSQGAPVPGVTVGFVVSKGEAYLGATAAEAADPTKSRTVLDSVQTTSSGLALVWVRAGGESGEINVSAILPEYPTVPNVLFTLHY